MGDKKAEAVVSQTVKWIIYLAILIAAGFAVKMIVGKFAGG